MQSSDLDPENLRSWRLTKAAIFALIGIGAVVWLAVDQHRASKQRELARTGSTARARLVEVESRRGGQHLTLSYRFEVHGRTYDIQKRRVGDYEGVASDNTLTVWYDPADPERCVTQGELNHVRFGWTPYLYAGAIVVMMALAAFQARKVLQPARPGDDGD